MVTVTSNNGGEPVFSIGNGVVNAAISNLAINIGLLPNQVNSEVLYNDGTLVLTGVSISGGLSPTGGGILNDFNGTLMILDSTLSGNGTTYASSTNGGGLYNIGTAKIVNTAISFNAAEAGGAGLYNTGTVTIADSNIVGNVVYLPQGSGDSPVGAGIFAQGSLTISNSAIGENYFYTGTLPYIEDDCDGNGCPTNGVNGNVVGDGAPFTAPGGSPICAGLLTNIPLGITTDQRGVARTTTYSTPTGNVTCVDSGAIQTHYALAFSTEPPATVEQYTPFGAVVEFSESGEPYWNGYPVPIALSLAAGDNGILENGSGATNSNGQAVFTNLLVSEPGTGDALVTSVGVTGTLSVSATSTTFNVTASSLVQVTLGTSPAGAIFSVDGVSYSAPVTLTWVVGSQHTLAVTSPQALPGAQYTFSSWSDGGALSHTVTASSSTTSYTANFNAAFELITASNPSQGGTVSPASDTYYPAGTVVNLVATRNPGYVFAGWTGNVASASQSSTTIAMVAPESVTANFSPGFVVNTNSDDATGVASNCTKSGGSCTLRDVLAAAAAAPVGSVITFDPTAFAATQPVSARTITLKNGTLNVPANTTINGATTGNGLTQLVTVNGNNQWTDFTVSAANVVISGLIITGGNNAYASQGGGGILINNGGTLTINNTTVSGNSADGQGGGIFNAGTLVVTNSIISGNTIATYGGSGGGIENDGGTLIVTDSTISGNTFGGGGAIDSFIGTVTVSQSTIAGNSGGGFEIQGSCCDSQGNTIFATLTLANSTVAGNTGGGLGFALTNMTVTNSIVAGNTAAGSMDCTSFIENIEGCPTNGTNGNVVGVSPLLAPLANYGGPTQTQPPLPGSPAICTGIAANLPGTDQRGFPRTTTYGSNPPCVDSGAVQTNYALSFSSEPPASVPPSVNFTAAIQLRESGNPFPVGGVSIPVALGSGDAGSLNVSSLSTNSSGIAGSGTLQVSAEGTGDTLVATLPVTTTSPPAPLTSAIDIGATSSAFNVGRTHQTITFAAPASPVSYGVSPIMLSATASSGLPVTFSILSGPATVSGNTLTITGVGMIVVAANQAGNADYTAAAQVTQTIVVNKGTLSLTLAVAPASPVYGTLVTFTGSPAPAGSTSTDFSFVVDKGTANSTIVPATVTANATVTATYGQLKTGTHTVELDFSGTANYAAAASPSVAVNVTQATPAITWSPASSIPYGTSAASLLNATANTPGTFTYTAQKAGGNAISLTATTILAVGSYTLTTSFVPNDSVDYKSATQMASLSVTQKTLTVTANNATRAYGTANPSFTGTVTGAVNGDVFTEAFTTTATTTSNAGNYAIVPSVTGADLADYTLVVENGALTVTQAASATAITSSTVNANLNASVTFTATITSSTTGTPTGSVEFLNGSTVLGSAPLNNQGVATYMTSALPAGTDTINAVYAGNQNFTGSMATLMQQVTAPNFLLKSSATQLSLIGGDTGQLTITLTPVGGYTGMTSFSCAGLPQNATCSFNPPTLTADGSNSPVTTMMTITTDGPGSGTVGLLRPQSPGTPALLASLAGLPACFAGLILFCQRKRLSPPVRRLFCAALLIGGLAGSVAISACGGSSQPKTPPGTSTVSVMAAGSGNNSQSITITLTVTQ